MILWDFLEKSGHADVGGKVKIIEEYISTNEQVIQTFKFLRDSIVLTNFGICLLNVQGESGKKVEIKFYPKKKPLKLLLLNKQEHLMLISK